MARPAPSVVIYHNPACAISRKVPSERVRAVLPAA
jgi:arsenate reductase-like glutaredoxin family protein